MSKKVIYFLLMGLLFGMLLFLPITYALTPSEAETAYLKQEWSKIFEQNEAGRIVLAFGNVLTSLNPIFKIIVGVEYSFSWYFTFAFLIWIAFFVFFFSLGRAIFLGKFIIVLILSFIITSFIGMSGAIREIDNVLASFVNDTVTASLILLLAFVIIFLLSKLGFSLSKIAEDYLKDLKEQKVEEDKKIIEATAKGIREGLKKDKK
jgi:hypothetical protein